jgi:hypothetical protein
MKREELRVSNEERGRTEREKYERWRVKVVEKVGSR